MKLLSIKINKLPGIYKPFSIKGFSTGINIIYGPNGSGKSSICRLIQKALWGGSRKNIRDTDANIKWSDKGAIYHTEISNDITWKKEDGLKFYPDTIDLNLLACCHVSIAEMFDSKYQPESEIAKKIYIEMTGGYDFNSVKSKFSLTRNFIKKEIENYESFVKQEKELNLEINKLAEEQDSLDELTEELKVAKGAQKDLEELKKANSFFEIRKEVEAKKLQLRNFPEIISQLTGNELENLNEQNNEISTLETELHGQEQKVNNIKEEITNVRPSGSMPDQQGLDEIYAKLSKLRSLDNTLNQFQIDYNSIKEKLRKLAEDLRQYNIETLEFEESISVENIRSLLNFVDRFEALSKERALLITKKQCLKKI